MMTWYYALLLFIVVWSLGYLSAWFCLSRARDEAQLEAMEATRDLLRMADALVREKQINKNLRENIVYLLGSWRGSGGSGRG